MTSVGLAGVSSAGLVSLMVRRVFSRTYLIYSAVVVALGQLQGTSFTGATDPADEALLRAARRESTWLFLALFALPPLMHCAASTGRRWREADRDWIGPRAVSRLRFVASTWLGAWIASAIVAVALAALGELSAAGDGPSSRRLMSVPAPTLMLVESNSRGTWEVGDSTGELSAARHLRLELRATPGAGPTAGVRIVCRRVQGGQSSTSEGIVSGRTRIEIPLPAGEGDLELSLEKLGAGCGVVVLPDSLALFEPARSERGAVHSVLVRTVLWSGTWIAIAIGLGTWMRAFTATTLTLALQLPLWTLGAAPASGQLELLRALVPGLDLCDALALIGDGLVAPMPSALSFVGLALGCALGLGLAVVGLDRGGTE